MTTKPESPDSGASADLLRQLDIAIGDGEKANSNKVVKLLRACRHTISYPSCTRPFDDEHTHGASDQAVWVDGADLGFLSDMPPNGSRATRLFNKQVLPCMVPLYTRAQDSGQGEAVSFTEDEIRVALSKANGDAYVTRGTVRDAREFLKQIGTIHAPAHPPKPAQDAAGKGAEELLEELGYYWDWNKSRWRAKNGRSDPAAGKGMEVACARIVMKAGKIEHIEYATDLVLPDGTHDVSLHTSAKPAQDAAGRGVEYPQISDEQRLWNWSGGRASAWIPVKTLAMLEAGEMQTAVIRWGDVSTFDEPATSLHPAKPAQVGQKYRPVTLEDARTSMQKWDEIFYGRKDIGTADAMLIALQSIGAVVPAQDGGV